MAEYLNSLSDDWTTTDAEQSTDKAPTIKYLKRIMREFQEKWKDVDLGPDVLVLTHAEMQELKLHCQKRDLVMEPTGISSPWNIYGIRVEECATKLEVKARVAELASKGVKAGFIKESE